MTRIRPIAVVTTFSLKGYVEYGARMIETWIDKWPDGVTLYVYPDEPIPTPGLNSRVILDPIPEKLAFIERHKGVPHRNGIGANGAYNYRFDAVKFCHKPFALWHFANRLNPTLGNPAEGVIWLDADTITHTPIPMDVVQKQIAPNSCDVQFLGRCYKYTECGYLWFNLRRPRGLALLNRWTDYYLADEFLHEAEWHDSWLFDCARRQIEALKEKDLTGHLPRRQGAGHPFVNSFLGAYMDHFKGDARKAASAPRPNDLFVDHGDNAYWKGHPHANARR